MKNSYNWCQVDTKQNLYDRWHGQQPPKQETPHDPSVGMYSQGYTKLVEQAAG